MVPDIRVDNGKSPLRRASVQLYLLAEPHGPLLLHFDRCPIRARESLNSVRRTSTLRTATKNVSRYMKSNDNAMAAKTQKAATPGDTTLPSSQSMTRFWATP